MLVNFILKFFKILDIKNLYRKKQTKYIFLLLLLQMQTYAFNQDFDDLKNDPIFKTIDKYDDIYIVDNQNKENNISLLSSKIILSQNRLQQLINEESYSETFNNLKIDKNYFINGGIKQLGNVNVKINDKYIVFIGKYQINGKITYKNFIGRTSAKLSDTILQLKVIFKPYITENWLIKFNNLSLKVKVSGDNKWFGIRINHFLGKKFKNIFLQKINNGISIGKRIKQQFKPKPLIINDKTKIRFWLINNPQTISINKPILHKKEISLNFSMNSNMQIVSDKDKYNTKFDLPSAKIKKISEPTRLYVPIKIKFNDLEKIIYSNHEVMDNKFIKIKNIKFFTETRNKLKIIIDYDRMGEDIHFGTLTVHATIRLDKTTQKIKIKEYTYDVNTTLSNFLKDKYNIFRLDKKLLSFDLDILYKYQKIFCKSLKDKIGLNVRLNKLNVDNVFLKEDELNIEVEAGNI